ncbi:uncharacterized protein LOC123864664 isoform X2 [Maniola jurtina]|uniref:uncharacterized protein LOC123864664 isoform X1 n=1 Tax=Maniola jurtina TaxID=191418 RepID=UPI001E686E8C|nr:uncharacterized protein LOC123864664 isoform X1 [Maniola jurtina]XP_045761236.1 uncharacterized protein LOC123864664 isoform X2 [Maniola jurtina]
MKCAIFVCFILFNNISLLVTKDVRVMDLRRFIDLIQRRRYIDSDEDILGVPHSVEDLPEAEPIHPGHTLLRPSRGMLKSSVKFPHKDAGDMAVYGNFKNLGITFGKTNQRLLYTNFRKAENILTYLLEKAIRNIQKKKHSTQQERKPVVIIEIDPANLKRMAYDYPFKKDLRELSDIDNNASEALDGSNEANANIFSLPTRRKSSKRGKSSKFRESETTDTSDSSDSSDYESNPGNPYTVHKDKYKQNWMWNHVMDGSHMNVNPYAPKFDSQGPSAAAFFFGRKWWYYNQDDFQPLS